MRTLHMIDYPEAQRAVEVMVGKALETGKAAAVAVAKTLPWPRLVWS